MLNVEAEEPPPTEIQSSNTSGTLATQAMASRELLRLDELGFTEDQLSELAGEPTSHHELQAVLSMRERFAGEAIELFGKRDDILSVKEKEVPLWGGPKTFAVGDLFHADRAVVHIDWDKNIVEACNKGLITHDRAIAMMKESVVSLADQSKARLGQIKSFLDLQAVFFKRNIQVSLSLLSRNEFVYSAFEKRSEILSNLRVALADFDQSKEKKAEKNASFEQKMKLLDGQASTKKQPEVAWENYVAMEAEARDQEVEGAEQWLKYACKRKNQYESQVSKWADQIHGQLAQPKNDILNAKLQKAADRLASMSVFFRIQSNLAAKLANLEEGVLYCLEDDSREDQVVTEIPSDLERRRILFQGQLGNETLRRLLCQIAAFSMSMGQNKNNSHKGQKSLVTGSEKVNQKELARRQDQKLAQTVAERNNFAQNNVETEGTQGTDVISAIQESPEDIEVDHTRNGIKAAANDNVQKNHQSAGWEMIHVIGMVPWTTAENERYLREAKEAGQHIIMKELGMVISESRVKHLLIGMINQSLQHMPGNSVVEKRAYATSMIGLVREAPNKSHLAEEIFSYTAHKGDVKITA